MIIKGHVASEPKKIVGCITLFVLKSDNEMMTCVTLLDFEKRKYDAIEAECEEHADYGLQVTKIMQ